MGRCGLHAGRAHGGARRGGTITTFDREIFDCETADSENTPAGGKAARRAASCSACCDVGTMQATPPARQDTSSITRSITTVRCWRILDDHRGAFGVASSGYRARLCDLNSWVTRFYHPAKPVVAFRSTLNGQHCDDGAARSHASRGAQGRYTGRDCVAGRGRRHGRKLLRRKR